MKKFEKSILLIGLILTAIFTSSCYRMPGEDDYSLIPTTNNPSVTREGPSTLIPGGSF